MKNKKMLGIGVILFAVVIVGASILYNGLKDKVEDHSFQLEGESNEDYKDSTDNEQADANTDSEAEDKQVAAPDFTMTDKDGNEVKFSDFSGKPIVLNFWASWCGPCQMEMPDFDEMYKTYGEEVNFVMVNMTDGGRETVETASAFIEKNGYDFPVLFDTQSEAAMVYGAYSLPTSYFINAEGHVIAQAVGAIDAATLQKGIDMITN